MPFLDNEIVTRSPVRAVLQTSEKNIAFCGGYR